MCRHAKPSRHASPRLACNCDGPATPWPAFICSWGHTNQVSKPPLQGAKVPREQQLSLCLQLRAGAVQANKHTQVVELYSEAAKQGCSGASQCSEPQHTTAAEHYHPSSTASFRAAPHRSSSVANRQACGEGSITWPIQCTQDFVPADCVLHVSSKCVSPAYPRQGSSDLTADASLSP